MRKAEPPMPHVVLFTQPNCLPCEFIRIYLEAREIVFEERDISRDPDARRAMTETYKAEETPTLVSDGLVISGFDPARLDLLLHSPSSSDSVTES
jgi:glutaredoxin